MKQFDFISSHDLQEPLRKINTRRLYKEKRSNEELFSEQRTDHVEHLGQVKAIYLEFSGKMSIYYFTDAEVRPGLNILPNHLDEREETIKEEGYYSCTSCAFTEHLRIKEPYTCRNCGNGTPCRASHRMRIA